MFPICAIPFRRHVGNYLSTEMNLAGVDRSFAMNGEMAQLAIPETCSAKTGCAAVTSAEDAYSEIDHFDIYRPNSPIQVWIGNMRGTHRWHGCQRLDSGCWLLSRVAPAIRWGSVRRIENVLSHRHRIPGRSQILPSQYNPQVNRRLSVKP